MKRFFATESFEASLYISRIVESFGIDPEKKIAILYDLINPVEETYRLIGNRNLNCILGYQTADFGLVLENNWIGEIPYYIILDIFSGRVWLDEKVYRLGLIEQSLVYYDVIK